MGTLNEDLTAIKTVEDKIIANKVAKFAYTDEAYDKNDADGVTEYNVNNAQNIPTADPSVLKVNNTVLSKGYRAQASSITRMLMNHFLGRLSYNVNKVNDGFSNLVATLIKHRGTANGFATLDENGRIPFSQLPESAMEYKGQWNAETNTPTLVDGTGTKGDFYIVSVAGTHNFGSGDIQFFVNDRVIYDGSVWSRLSAGDVKTVNNISPVNGNIPLTGENILVSSTDPTLLSAPLTTDRYANNSVTTEKLADNAVTNAKIKDPVSVAKGGTGATDAKNGFMNLANGLAQSQNPQDTEYMIYKSSGNWGLYTLLQFWEYIKTKISSALGLTATQYNGNSATATNATSANTAISANTATQATGATPFNASIQAVTAGTVTRAVAQNVVKIGNGYTSRIALGLTNKVDQFSDGIISLGSNDAGTSWEDFIFKIGTGGEVITSATINEQTVNKATDAYNAYRGMVHTCSTDARTVEKTVSVTGFTLTTGACIRVVFTNGNNIIRPTLNVNNTGAKEIVVPTIGNDSVKTLSLTCGSQKAGALRWDPNTILELYYNGTYWVVMNNPVVFESNEAKSYKVHINGWKEITIVGTDSTENSLKVLLPIAFTETNYFAIASAYDNKGDYPIMVTEKSKNSVVINRASEPCKNWGIYIRGY